MFAIQPTQDNFCSCLGQNEKRAYRNHHAHKYSLLYQTARVCAPTPSVRPFSRGNHQRNDFFSLMTLSPSSSVTRQATNSPNFLYSSPESVSAVHLLNPATCLAAVSSNAWVTSFSRPPRISTRTRNSETSLDRH